MGERDFVGEEEVTVVEGLDKDMKGLEGTLKV